MAAPLSKTVVKKANHMLAQGTPKTDIANSLDICTRSVDRIAERNKDAIEKLTQQYVNESIPLIKDIHTGTLTLSKEIIGLLNTQTLSNDQEERLANINQRLDQLKLTPKTILQLSDKKEYRALLTMGIVPSHTQSIAFNQVFNQQNNYASPELQKALAQYGEQTRENETVIDV